MAPAFTSLNNTKWGVFSMTMQRPWSLSPPKKNWLKEEVTRFAVPECPLSWTGCAASKNSSGHFSSPFCLKLGQQISMYLSPQINTGREHPYYAHFTDEETEAEWCRNGLLQSPPAHFFCIASLVSASSTTNLGLTHRGWSPLDADPLMAKVRSLLCAQEQLFHCTPWGFPGLMPTPSLSEKLGRLGFCDWMECEAPLL